MSRKKQKEFKLKIENIQRKVLPIYFSEVLLISTLSQLGIPLTLYAATREDNYRKPCIGMWKDLLLRLNHAAINLEKSFFIGDAAGRPPGWKQGKKADHSDVDRKFGQNLGIQFFTPEQHFLGADPEPFVTSSFQPRLVFTDLANDDSSFLVPKALNCPEIVIFIGYPASGKTFFYLRYLASSHQRLSPVLINNLDILQALNLLGVVWISREMLSRGGKMPHGWSFSRH